MDSNVIALTSLVITLISILWNVFFGYGKLVSRMDTMQNDLTGLKASVIHLEEKMDKRFEKVESKIEDLRIEVHKMDIRVSVLELRK